MSNKVNELEAAVLGKLLAGDFPVLACLRAQCQRMHVTAREFTGVGFFTDFGHPDDAVRLSPSDSFHFGDVTAELGGLQHAAGFIIFIEDGLISMLEGHSWAAEAWPDELGQFELRYWPPERDLGRRVIASEAPGTDGPS